MDARRRGKYQGKGKARGRTTVKIKVRIIVYARRTGSYMACNLVGIWGSAIRLRV